MLEGYRVVELAAWVAGPAAGGILADWGADVVKVEPPAGDPQRRIFGALGIDVATVPPFELDNRGKRSVVLDLRTAAGVEAMQRLLATADVFVTNLRPDALERLGLDHGALLRAVPEPRLRQRDGVRPRRSRSRPAGLRRRGVLGPLVDGPVARAATASCRRASAAVSATT